MSVPKITDFLEKICKCNNTDNYRIKIRQRDDYLYASAEYSANQTGTSFIAAPGAGYRIVIKGIWYDAAGTTGEIIFTGTVAGASKVIDKAYVTKYNNKSNSGIRIPMDENTAITITSTTGTDKIFVKINYVVDMV